MSYLVVVLFTVLVAFSTSGCLSPPPYDLVIRGGNLVDGSGAPSRRADVGIRGDTIAVLGDLEDAQAIQVIEAQGLVVAPGFIDMHSHSDFTLLVDGRGLSKVTQGVTTELLGEATSAAPVEGPLRSEQEIELSSLGLTLDWTTLEQYFQRLEQSGMSVNILSTVGSGQVRACVVGYEDRPATAEEVGRMQELVEQAMRDGAVGLSSGLIYSPNRYASTEELIGLAKVAAGYGGFYLSHIRGEDDQLLTALQEAIEIGRQAGLPVEVLHFKRSSFKLDQEPSPSIQEAAALIEEAQAEGVQVHANLYPYSASQTGLGVRIPNWVHEGGREKLLQRLRDSRTRRRIGREITDLFSKRIAGATPETILFGATPYLPHQPFQGMYIAEIAREMGVEPAEAIIELVEKAEGDTKAIYFGIREQDMLYALVLPWTSIGSDGRAIAPEGILASGHPHPRWYGSFPRILGRYVREQQVLSLEEAIRKMTSLPASRLGLTDRGLVEAGKKADLAIFNPDTIIDLATFENPHQLSQGVEYLVVNGQLVLEQGQHTGALPGRVLRHTAATGEPSP